jgi:glycosyltransferase involved in cell wall biosynthesis
MKVEQIRNPTNHSKLTFRPFFSIIITTYNRANILKKAIESMILQTEYDWEVIIIDDESTDDTYLKVLPYIRSDNRIRYMRKAHSGEAMSKNAGINSSAGRFVSFLDSDDEYSPVHLQSRKSILSHNPSVNFLYGGVKIIGNQYVPDRFDSKKKIHLSECVIGGTFFIERNTLFQLKGFRKIKLGTDADLFERAVQAGVIMKETEIPSYIYHHETEDSITNMLIKSTLESDVMFSEISPQ